MHCRCARAGPDGNWRHQTGSPEERRCDAMRCKAQVPPSDSPIPLQDWNFGIHRGVTEKTQMTSRRLCQRWWRGSTRLIHDHCFHYNFHTLRRRLLSRLVSSSASLSHGFIQLIGFEFYGLLYSELYNIMSQYGGQKDPAKSARID
jgi:hypothetical protein